MPNIFLPTPTLDIISRQSLGGEGNVNLGGEFSPRRQDEEGELDHPSRFVEEASVSLGSLTQWTLQPLLVLARAFLVGVGGVEEGEEGGI